MRILITLDQVMAKRKMSLKELSQKTGVSLGNLSIFKTGRSKGVRFSTLNKICKVLECKPCDIIDQISDEEYRKLYRMSDA